MNGGDLIKKNIAFIIPSLCGGGAERVISILSLNIPNKYNLYIITYENKKINYDHGGTVINLNLPGTSKKIDKLISTVKRIYKLRKIKNKYNIEKSISFLDNPNTVNILSRCKDKVIISVRNQRSKECGSSNNLTNYIINKLYSKSDKIIALSNGVRKDLIDNLNILPEKIGVIYNPLDINYINSLKEQKIEKKYEKIFNNKNYVIITSGRLTYQKGQWYLLRSFKKVLETISNVNLVILGEGELESDLKQMTVNMKIDNNVYFLGFQSNPFKYIKNSDLFVFTSLFEGFGNVITESMACGTVVISSDCKSGPKEILNPSDKEKLVDDVYLADYGVLIPEFDGKKYDENSSLTKSEEILTKGIIELINNKSLKDEYEKKILDRVTDFDPKVIVNKWCEL
ncbi:glycosyltransferase [Clostridium butyricum]|uniref:glycosyltransferase n=1 Tax=Clostridium butyricum TaxID=1492 RepID=UPI003D358A3F